MLDPGDLAVPIVLAPMAGGPSTVALAAAVSDAGGLGFLAAGYRTAEDVRAQIEELGSRPYGLNVFVPSAAPGEDTATYAARLAAEGPVGEPRFEDDDWDAKLALCEELAPRSSPSPSGCPAAT